MKKTTKSITNLFLLTFLFCSLNGFSVSFPTIKKEIDVEHSNDTINKVTTETHIYSFPTINRNGLLGTYVEEFVYNTQGNVLSRTQTKHDVPFLGCEKVHLITSKKTLFNLRGDITKIYITKKLSEGMFVKKDLKILFTESGEKVKQNNLKEKHVLHGYKKPSKAQLYFHKFKH